MWLCDPKNCCKNVHFRMLVIPDQATPKYYVPCPHSKQGNNAKIFMSQINPSDVAGPHLQRSNPDTSRQQHQNIKWVGGASSPLFPFCRTFPKTKGKGVSKQNGWIDRFAWSMGVSVSESCQMQNGPIRKARTEPLLPRHQSPHKLYLGILNSKYSL